MLDLCVREIPSITFYDASQEEMVNVCADLEGQFAKSKTVPGTNKIAHKFTSEDREFLQFHFNKSLTEEIDLKSIQVFFTCQLYLQYILVDGIVTKSECT